MDSPGLSKNIARQGFHFVKCYANRGTLLLHRQLHAHPIGLTDPRKSNKGYREIYNSKLFKHFIVSKNIAKMKCDKFF